MCVCVCVCICACGSGGAVLEELGSPLLQAPWLSALGDTSVLLVKQKHKVYVKQKHGLVGLAVAGLMQMCQPAKHGFALDCLCHLAGASKFLFCETLRLT